jgi:hypothetical protein
MGRLPSRELPTRSKELEDHAIPMEWRLSRDCSKAGRLVGPYADRANPAVDRAARHSPACGSRRLQRVQRPRPWRRRRRQDAGHRGDQQGRRGLLSRGRRSGLVSTGQVPLGHGPPAEPGHALLRRRLHARRQPRPRAVPALYAAATSTLRRRQAPRRQDSGRPGTAASSSPTAQRTSALPGKE